jgi:NTP pyrophosphatase (non-canonical NTP hydrolase)
MLPNKEHVLRENMPLSELQAYIKEMCALNGWDNDSIELKYLLFSEEVGELAKAIRRHRHIYDETGAQGGLRDEHLAEEFADVLSYLMDLANMAGVDLDKALREKTEKNLGREWTY